MSNHPRIFLVSLLRGVATEIDVDPLNSLILQGPNPPETWRMGWCNPTIMMNTVHPSTYLLPETAGSLGYSLFACVRHGRWHRGAFASSFTTHHRARRAAEGQRR